MKIGIMQPYFMPYIGYFQLMKAVDKYVIYNDVNYIKGGWVARNSILVGKQKHLISIALESASQNKHFTDIQIKDDFKKLRKTLEFNYHRAPFFNPVMNLLNSILSFTDRRLDLFLANSFREILSYLDIHTDLILSSDIEKNNSLKGADKILEICKILKADTYYNAIGGMKLYDKKLFKDNGIDIMFLRTDDTLSYSQFQQMDFIPNLSIIDILMFNSPAETNSLLDRYFLV